VVLHGMGDLVEKTLVVFLDCGGLYPDIPEWVRREGEKLPNFLYVDPYNDIWDDIHSKGFALDLQPAELGDWGEQLASDPLCHDFKVRPWTQCMYERVWRPLHRIVQEYKPDLLVTGERGQDRPYAVWEDPVPFCRPIFEWKDFQVWAYIDRHEIELAPTYRGRQKDRRDCWLCFGGHDMTPQRLLELKENWPDLWEKLFEEEKFGVLLERMATICESKGKVYRQILELTEETHALSATKT